MILSSEYYQADIVSSVLTLDLAGQDDVKLRVYQQKKLTIRKLRIRTSEVQRFPIESNFLGVKDENEVDRLRDSWL